MHSSPNVPEEPVLYDPDGRHREIFEALTQDTYVYCRVKRRGRRGNRLAPV
ncbi:hypothetical protein E4U57_001221 [Claviceps arundinis]|uniref:Uncharacterized protein n=1 Tax=Claviceps arundinis TaxID=1623583 RepID=A0ABQ7PB24_9HYPO|nr:hypothetical protein E4U57_001221 [Claviceps arundinis]